jgi:hypothetical protein
MTKNIFRTVRELLESRSAVTLGNAVHTEGYLYDDSVENLHALDMMEPSLLELVRLCVSAGVQSKALDEIIELLGYEGEY